MAVEDAAADGAAAAAACDFTTQNQLRPWDALPRDVLAHVVAHLTGRSAQAATATVCRAWNSVLAAHITYLRAVPLGALSRLLDRFPAASHASFADDSTGAGANPLHCIPSSTPAAPATFTAALMGCSRPLRRLSIGPRLAAAGAIEALCSLSTHGGMNGCPRARASDWTGHLASLDLDLSFVLALPKSFSTENLPALRQLTVSNYCGPTHGLEPLLACSGLTQLRVRGLYSGLPQMGAALPRLRRLEVANAYNLTELFQEGPTPPALQALSIQGCHRLSTLDLAPLTHLTSLVLRGCSKLFAVHSAPGGGAAFPPAVAAAAEGEQQQADAGGPALLAAAAGGAAAATVAATAALGAAAAAGVGPLRGLGQLASLRRLELGTSPGLGFVQLPQGVTNLTALTALVLNGCCPGNQQRGRRQSRSRARGNDGSETTSGTAVRGNRRGRNTHAAAVAAAAPVLPPALVPVLPWCVSLRVLVVGGTALRGAALWSAVGTSRGGEAPAVLPLV